MGARTKLNAAALQGSLIVAAVVGVAFESWTVFVMVAVLLIGGDFYAGTIRPDSRHFGPRRR